MATRVKSSFERCVFVNAPFDDDFLPLLHALLFTIHDCGFIARLAVEDTGASEMRIDKIVRIIRESCYSIHDISRVEGAGVSALPRFNMPFEAGLAMGATRVRAGGQVSPGFPGSGCRAVSRQANPQRSRRAGSAHPPQRS